jgi:tetratricopeptide (TPR) repeat protein
MWSVVGAAAIAPYGPQSVNEALTVCGEILDRVRGQPGHEAVVCKAQGCLEAMRGYFEEARIAIARARSILTELGVAHSIAGMTDSAADVERYAGETQAEEREWRSGYDVFAATGATGYQATWAAGLARALVELGRDDEALELTHQSESLADQDDMSAQVPWREARARVLARRGKAQEAERLAREAVAIAKRTDWLNLQGDAHMALADVIRSAGRQDEAAEAAKEALDRYARKGNVVAEGWARNLLQGLSAPGT